MQPESESTKLGLQSDEQILRGGHLSGPVILSGLAQAAGKRWVSLAKSNTELLQYLVKKGNRRQDFGALQTFTRIAALRDEVQNNLLERLRATWEPEEDKTASLGLDDASRKMSRAQKRILDAEILAKLPDTFDVSFPTTPGIEPWTFRVLAVPKKKTGHMPASIELTEVNLKRLHQQVSLELASSAAAERVVEPTKAAREPRISGASTEYWDAAKGRYVAFSKIEKLPGGARKYRKLTRVPTPSGTADGGNASCPAALVVGSLEEEERSLLTVHASGGCVNAATPDSCVHAGPAQPPDSSALGEVSEAARDSLDLDS